MDGDAPEYLTTKEVAALLRVRERKVYDLAAAGEIPCRRLIGKLLFPRAEILSWLGRGAEPAAPAPLPRGVAVIAGSHDPLLDWAIRESESGLACLFDGSMDGVDRLAAGAAAAAGMHVYEAATGDWNRGVAAAALGRMPVALLGWARRRRGLILGPRAAHVRDLADLAGLKLVRRQAASGACLWLDHTLVRHGLSGAVQWTGAIARTETEAAAAVASGEADAAAGLEAAARPFGLRFLPMVDECFDLAVDRRAFFEPPLQRLFAFARTPAFAARAEALGGYDLGEHGTVRWNA